MRKKFIITNPKHPHSGETGEIIESEEGTITVHEVFGKRMMRLYLIDCPHLVESCMVSTYDIKPMRGQ
jgi:hypothetical protein